MNRDMMVHVTPFEVHAAILENDKLVEYSIERRKNVSVVGNIFKGKVGKVLPGMQSAFVDIGLEKHAFLYVTDFLEEFADLKDTLADEEEEKKEGASKEKKEEAPQPESKEAARGDVPTKAAAVQIKTEDQVAPAKAVPKTPKEKKTMDSGTRGQVKAEVLQDANAQLHQFYVEQETEQTASEATAELSFTGSEVKYSDGPQSRKSSGKRRRRKSYASSSGASAANISTMLRQGQEIIVQVMKGPIALKSARITSHISIPGRMLVLMPTFNRIGVSRKIKSDQERKRLRSIIKANTKDKQIGFIVRTASEGCSEADLIKDMNYLLKTWQSIQERSVAENAPCLLNEELDLVERILRDKLDETFETIWVDDEEEYAHILDFMDNFMPEMLSKVKLYNREQPIFDFFNLFPEIQKATKQKVWLRSGGSIVINHTEALVAIDVNTGKYVGKTSNFEETITKINVDAAHEITRQIRLRNLGGIIVMDFIDMLEKKSKKRVMDIIYQELKKDKAPSKVLSFNDFGLVIMTRKRTSGALEKNLTEACSVCGGTGYTKSISTICYEVFSQIERLHQSLTGKSIVIRANPEIITALKTEEKDVVKETLNRFNQELVLIPDPLLSPQNFNVTNE